jgi:hydrogenase nickel incorporation protein HypA/HybF
VHELSIAECVVGIAVRHARGRPVTKVALRVGHLRQVVPSALELSFELVAQGTCVEGAELELEDVPAGGICKACGQYTELPGFPLACRRCGGLEVDVTQGEELLVDSLELDDELATSGKAT